MLDLRKNFFELFAQSAAYDIDHDALTVKYRLLQKILHPDKFASGSAQEKRYSVQAAAYINEAYAVLKNNLQRASYLLSLNGVELDTETDTRVDPSFLIQQMEWRETLEKITADDDPLALADQLESQVHDYVNTLENDVREQLVNQGWQAARETVRKWQFLDKFQQELSAAIEQLEDAQDGT